MLQVFDAADPSLIMGKRDVTTVATQALFLMNSPFVVEQATNLVQRAEFKTLGSDGQRVRFLYQQTLQRDPTSDEVRLACRFLEAQRQFEAPHNALSGWEQYAQVLLLANELAFVD